MAITWKKINPFFLILQKSIGNTICKNYMKYLNVIMQKWDIGLICEKKIEKSINCGK